MALTKVQNTGIADDAVTTDKIENSTVLAADIAPGTITNAKLSNSAITLNGSSVSLGGTASVKHLDWQAVTVADGSTQLTAEAGKGYFLDTNTGVIEVLLPSSPTRGDTIALVDYGGTFGTNQCIINTGGQLIDSTSGPDFKVTTNNAVVEIVYVDSNKGYLVKLNQAAGTTPDNVMNTAGGYDTEQFIEATGGTITTSGNFKIHTFTGDGNFVVSSVASSPALSKVDYLVVAGGGSGGGGSNPPELTDGAGGGAGGVRESYTPAVSGPYTASPLKAACGAIAVTATTFPITVGGGGALGSGTTQKGSNGSNSVFSTITSAGGGAAGQCSSSPGNSGSNGGSGGGAGEGGTAGSGNTPPVSPNQGTNGGTSGGNGLGAGGGAVQAGGNGSGKNAGDGGAGAGTNINPAGGEAGPGSLRYYGGGGGGGTGPGGGPCAPQYTAGEGGVGGGGDGHINATTPVSVSSPGNPGAGVANTGGGGGGGGCAGQNGGAGAGGKGVVILRYKFQ